MTLLLVMSTEPPLTTMPAPTKKRLLPTVKL
jgi:hypothetical protein